MRRLSVDLVFAFSLFLGLACGTAALAIPGPIPCTTYCREVYVIRLCGEDKTYSLLSKSSCAFCRDGGCTVGGEDSTRCNVTDEQLDIDSYPRGVVACRACRTGDDGKEIYEYIEATIYEGDLLFTYKTKRTICITPTILIDEDGPPGGP